MIIHSNTKAYGWHVSDVIHFIYSLLKPVVIMHQYTIKEYSAKGDQRGTTAIAAIRNKRKFIGFELSKDYYDMACKRIKQETQQLSLF